MKHRPLALRKLTPKQVADKADRLLAELSIEMAQYEDTYHPPPPLPPRPNHTQDRGS